MGGVGAVRSKWGSEIGVIAAVLTCLMVCDLCVRMPWRAGIAQWIYRATDS